MAKSLSKMPLPKLDDLFTTEEERNIASLGNKYSPTVLIAPLTSKSKKKNYLPTHIEIKSNEKITHDSLILLEQVRVLDKTRLISFLCSLNEEEINLVNKSLKDTFDIK